MLRHPLSIAGVALATAAGVGFVAMCLAAALGLFSNPYAGLVIFVALPALLVLWSAGAAWVADHARRTSEPAHVRSS